MFDDAGIEAVDLRFLWRWGGIAGSVDQLVYCDRYFMLLAVKLYARSVKDVLSTAKATQYWSCSGVNVVSKQTTTNPRGERESVHVYSQGQIQGLTVCLAISWHHWQLRIQNQGE